jgi:hypothetical protein
MMVNGITNANSIGVTGILTLLAQRDDSYVKFLGSPSTFSQLGVRADNGILLVKDLTTTSGALFLNGDSDSDNSADSINYIGFTDGSTLMAKTLMTLEAKTGSVLGAGTLTLKAGTGMVINDDVTPLAGTSGNRLTLESDYEIAGDGTLTVAQLKTVTTSDGELLVTAWDVDIGGWIQVGTNSLTLHGSKVAQTLAIGGTSKDLHISTNELSRISTTGRED